MQPHTPMKAELMIEGVPAGEFVNRRVKIWSRGKSQHPCLGMVTGVNGTAVLVKPVGHKKVEKVDPAHISALWSENDDLRQKYQIAPEVVDDGVEDVEDEVTEKVAELPAQPTPPPVETPPVEEQPTVEDIIPPPMIVHAKDQSWIPVYDRYLNALRAEQRDQQMLEELMQVLAEHKQQQHDLVAELALLGVEVQLEIPAAPTPEPVPEPPAPEPAKPKSRPRGLAGRKALEKAFQKWVTDTERQLWKGNFITIVVSDLAKSFGGFTSTSVWSRLRLLEETTNLKMEPAEAHGSYRVMLK